MRSKIVYEMSQGKFLPAYKKPFLGELKVPIQNYFSQIGRGGTNSYYLITPFPHATKDLLANTFPQDNDKICIEFGSDITQKTSRKKSSREDFDEKIYVYKSDNETLLLKATLSDLRNLYFFGEGGITSKDIERQRIFINELDSLIENFYAELLWFFLHREDGSFIFKNAKESGDSFKHYIPIREEIVRFFDIENNALIKKKLGIKEIEIDPFLFFKGDDPTVFNKVWHKRREKVPQFLKNHQDDDSDIQNNVNDTKRRYFVDKIYLVEFLFQEFLPAILDCKGKYSSKLSVEQMSTIDLRGKAVVEWLCSAKEKTDFCKFFLSIIP